MATGDSILQHYPFGAHIFDKVDSVCIHTDKQKKKIYTITEA